MHRCEPRLAKTCQSQLQSFHRQLRQLLVIEHPSLHFRGTHKLLEQLI